MGVYIVTYELRKPGKDYKSLYDYLKGFTHCHNSTSCWFIDTTQTTEQVRDGGNAHIDSNDILFVGKLAYDWHGYGVVCGAWLNDSSRRW
jgi:hypothetical protein